MDLTDADGKKQNQARSQDRQRKGNTQIPAMPRVEPGDDSDSITRSTFEKAYNRLIQDQVGENAPKEIVGPKTLNVYGAPYVWAVFAGIGLIEETLYIQEEIELN